MLPKNKCKSACAAMLLALSIVVGASWSPAAPVTNPGPMLTPAPQGGFTITPIGAIDIGGDIIIRVDPPELSAVFPVLP